MNEINPLRLHHLRNDEHYQFHSQSIDLINEIGAAKLHIEALLAAYADAHKTEGDILRVIRGSEKTATIESADAERDAVISGLFQNIRSNLNSFDAAKKQAAEKLLPILNTYKDVNTLNYNAQSAAVTSFVNDLEADGVKDAVSALGIADWIQAIAGKNNAFNDQWGSRADDAALKASYSRMKDTRPIVDKAYSDITRYVNAWVVVNQPLPPEFTDYISRQNARVEEYKLLLNKRKAKSGDEPAPPEQPQA